MFFFPKDRSIRKMLGALTQSFHPKHSRYKAAGVLGIGGFGEVQKCFDFRLNRVVARKVLLPGKTKLDSRRVSLLFNEARLIGYLDHPGIVPIYDIFIDPEGEFSYTMKVLEGTNLEEMLLFQQAQREYLSLSQGLQIFTKVCETLAFAHSKGVLHLDLKPSNIMIGRYGEVMLLDWGSALLYDTSRYVNFLQESGVPVEGNEIVDQIQGSLGSVPHMPLEQLTMPRNTLTPTADVFSAGVLLYRMLSGTYPYYGHNVQEYAMALCGGKSRPLRELRDDIPPQLSDICMKMLSIDAEKRYTDLEEALVELQELSNSGSRFRIQTFAPGDILIREGDIGDFALHIMEGDVEISVQAEGQRKVLATRQKGDIIGELAIFSQQPRMATATALTPTTTRIMTQDDIEKELDKLPPWISLMIRGLSDKFIDRHKKIVWDHQSS